MYICVRASSFLHGRFNNRDRTQKAITYRATPTSSDRSCSQRVKKLLIRINLVSYQSGMLSNIELKPYTEYTKSAVRSDCFFLNALS